MPGPDRSERGAREYGDVRPHEQVTMLDVTGDFLRQAQQGQDPAGGGSSDGSPERHGSLEPDDSRRVTGALGGGAVREPGGADQQQGGARWSGGQQSQSQGGQSQSQGQQGQAFTAEEAARGRDAAFGEGTEQQEQAASVAQQDAGIVDQQGASLGGEAGDGQQAQLAPPSGQQGGGWEQGTPQAQQAHPYASRIREHMEVIGADGVHLGTVDKVEGNRIKLTKADSGMGGHQGHHHYISCGLVAEVEGDRVRLSATAANAYAMEEEE